MPHFDTKEIPRCTIDYPLDITPGEIVSMSSPVNTLIKSSYLIGAFIETEASFNTLFDIAEEIAGVEACGFLVAQDIAPDNWELKISRRIDPTPPAEHLPFLVAPAAIAARFGKAVSMDPDWGGWSAPICEAWSSRSLVAFPLRQDRDMVGAIVFGKKDSHPFTTGHVKLLWALSLQAESWLQRSGSIRPFLYYQLDPLTHLQNSRKFDDKLDLEIARSRRTGKPFSLLVLDIDGFKAYNDRFNTASGDIALQEFAGILEGCVRDVDTVARLGGDEFAVILIDCDAEGALILANRIIRRFRDHLLPGPSMARTEHLSASIGIASFPSDSFLKDDLVAMAERALALARGQGAGRVLRHQESTETGRILSPKQELPVRKIFDAGRSVVDMEKFLEILLFNGMQGMGARRGSIVVKDPAGDFYLRAAIGFGRQERQVSSSGPIPPGPVTSWVVDHQIPLVVSTPDDCPFHPPKRKNGYSTDSFLSIPLTHAGRTLGALHLTNRKSDEPFNREDLKSFAPIASEIAGILGEGMRFRENVREFSLSILGSLSLTLEMRYPFLSGHSGRVRDLSLRIGERFGIDRGGLDALRVAAELHDVGIVGIPGDILSKNRSLSAREMEMAREHPFLGAKLLEGVPGLEPAHRAILEHHENFDGSGYPYGLQGRDISLAARVLSIAEFYDSVLSDRPYRRGAAPEKALEMVRSGGGTLFDPEVAAIFADIAEGRINTSSH